MTWDPGAIELGGAPTPTPTPTPAPTPPPVTSCPKGQWLAQYFNNIDLSGTPVFSRCESAINYLWGDNDPGNGIAADNFSVRWSGTFTFPAGTIQFVANADDGVRVWVDNALIINAWKDQSLTTYQVTQNLTAGDHSVKVEYYERTGGAVIQLFWQPITTPTPTPTPPPTPAPVPTTLQLLVDGVVKAQGPIGQSLSYPLNTKNKTVTIKAIVK